MNNKIIGVYKITNTVTGDFYIGSSKDIKHRWAVHKCPSTLKKFPRNQMYHDIQKYGIDRFSFEILEKAESEHLKEKEQQFIELLKPTYNQMNAKGFDIERYKEYQKEYKKSDKCKESHKKSNNKYNNQLCYYNNETLTLAALSQRFIRAGIEYPTAEAKKYILNNSKVK